ncbi:MAG: hypothetical protein HY020_19285 [Burkholderiales bacterium]|nr:hypothetical protein [Burkholderiales bacterium]
MPSFVYVKIPLHPGQAERLPALHEDIERVLSADGLGELIGWGRSLPSLPGGRSGPEAAHHRLDIEVADQTRALVVLRHALAGLAVPDGTELHFTQDGQALQCLYERETWGSPMRSTATSRPVRNPAR